MTRVVCIGEAMVEMAPTGAPGTYAMAYAGDTFNTAWYLKTLRPDIHVAYQTCIGADAISDDFLAFAKASGVETDAVTRDAERSMGLYLISLKEGERSFSYWRDNSAARGLADDPQRLREGMAGADVIYFSGITLAILDDAGRTSLRTALEDARSAGATTVFDPNLRPRLWPDAETMCASVMAGSGVADIVLPSFEEEALFFGDATPQDTIARYRATGSDTVVVKDGAGSIRYACKGATGTFAVDPVATVVDTTSAGDSFNAGFLSSYLNDGCPVRAIERGSAISRRVIQARGALISLTDL